MTNKPISEVIAEVQRLLSSIEKYQRQGKVGEWVEEYRIATCPAELRRFLYHIAALEQQLAASSQKARNFEEVAHGLNSENDKLKQQLAAERARVVKLRKHTVGEVMHMSGFSRDYAEGWCAGNDNAIHEILDAGIPDERQSTLLFDEWFKSVEAGDDENWKEPKYLSKEWNGYLERMQLARGAWNAAMLQPGTQTKETD